MVDFESAQGRIGVDVSARDAEYQEGELGPMRGRGYNSVRSDISAIV